MDPTRFQSCHDGQNLTDNPQAKIPAARSFWIEDGSVAIQKAISSGVADVMICRMNDGFFMG